MENLHRPSINGRSERLRLERLSRYREILHDAEKNHGGDYLEILNETYGIEPVEMVFEGKRDDIPAAGWLIRAHITPGYQGSIFIFKYAEGNLSLGDITEDKYKTDYSQDRSFYLNFGLNASKEYMLTYDNPNPIPEHMNPGYLPEVEGFLERCSIDEVNQADCVYLDNAGRLFYSDNPTYIHCGRTVHYGFSREMVSLQLERSRTSVNRIVVGDEEIGAVLVSLGAGMGLGESDIRTLIATAGQKIGRRAEQSEPPDSF